jgi:hypothetical protein
MLAGEPMPGIGGLGFKLQSQTAALGWAIDDLLVTAALPGGDARLAISAKGNVQVGPSGIPPAVMEPAWELWNAEDGPMNRERDGIALVPRDHHPKFNSIWADLKNWSGEDDATALARIGKPATHKKVFESLSKSSPKKVESDERTLALVRRLHVLPVDFQLAGSQFENDMIAACRQLLVSRDVNEAQTLWNAIQTVARESRLGAGTVTLEGLWGELRKQFELRDHPNYAADWDELRRISADQRARIETRLPNGFSITRAKSSDFSRALREDHICVVYGESGTGKSALVKATLDLEFTNWNQVWLRSDVLSAALSAANQSRIGLRHAISNTLGASAHAHNVLVIDSAERIDVADLKPLSELIARLLPLGGDASGSPWRVVLIGQTQSWAERSSFVLSGRNARLIELDQVDATDVRHGLRASTELAWLAAHDQTVDALRNLQTLSWVIAAGSALGHDSSAFASHTAVADRLWKYWTADRIDLQGVIMRLSEREADFVASFPLQNIDPAEAGILQTRPPQLPIRRTSRNHIEFAHDLASDWARFQSLKAYADDIPRWAALAQNPLWTGALRMLGQFLLRERGRNQSAWDDAFAHVESAGTPLAADVLLDALVLDPQAEQHLKARADFLFADNGERLSRLLTRFQHVATFPANMPGLPATEAGLALYLEDKYRAITFAYWPPVLSFLISHRARMAPLISSAVIKICETWLRGTPTLVQGRAVAFRRDVAQLALDIAKELQALQSVGHIILDQEHKVFFRVPLLGAPDLAADVADWALQMVGRRPVSESVTNRIREEREKRARAHQERLKADPDYRKRHEGARLVPFSISSRRGLPPWPLGPQQRVDHKFRDACLDGDTLTPLMQVDPPTAAELLLALIIDDNPHEEYGGYRSEIDLGLEYNSEASPTIFWKSPFFRFLQITPDVAVEAIIQLVNFCNERWIAEARRDGGEPYAIRITQADGTDAPYLGNSGVFDWPQRNSNHSGHLHCALDALERWLTRELDTGNDVTAILERLLAEARSASTLGLLVNVGKYQPSLFAGVLRPLLTDPALFFFDQYRVKNVNLNFMPIMWVRQGEFIARFARQWILAPHRTTTLADVAQQLIREDEEAAAYLQKAMGRWELPADRKGALELRTLMAELDRSNHVSSVDPASGNMIWALQYPRALVDDVNAWQAQTSAPLHELTLPSRLEPHILQARLISDEDASVLWGWLQSALATPAPVAEELEDWRPDHRLLLATALVVCAPAWLASRYEVDQVVRDLLLRSAKEIGGTLEEIQQERFRLGSQGLEYAAIAAVNLWASGTDDATWEPVVLRLLTSGHGRAVSALVITAHRLEARLGEGFERLLLIGRLWSALLMLKPDYDDGPEVGTRWERWLTTLRVFPLRGKVSRASATLLDIERRHDRLQKARFARSKVGGKRIRMSLEDWQSPGLASHVFEGLYSWLVGEGAAGTGDVGRDADLVDMLWEYEAKRAQFRGRREGEYDLPSRFGYELLNAKAKLLLTVEEGRLEDSWQSVLAHGPGAHVALERFVDVFLMQAPETTDHVRLVSAWRGMLAYALQQDWNVPRLWFYGERILRHLLGFYIEPFLRELPAGLISNLADLYEEWAKAHLATEEENVRDFARFLTSPFALPIRLQGLQWMAQAVGGDSRAGRWHRDGTGSAVVELLDKALTDHGAELKGDATLRASFLELAALVAGRNIPAALPLQERIKLLRLVK